LILQVEYPYKSKKVKTYLPTLSDIFEYIRGNQECTHDARDDQGDTRGESEYGFITGEFGVPWSDLVPCGFT
jgi:hypothetical protein